MLLIAFSGRYGYHGDELYFLVAARHLAWSYPDLPPLVPLLARLLTDISPGSLVLLRTPSALAAAAIVVLTALTCRELGGGRAAQLLAAAAMAISPLLLAAAHLFGTTPFDLLFWTLLVYLVVHILRGGSERLWLVVGIAAGVGLLNKDLVAFLAFGVLAGLAIAGPRRHLASPLALGGRPDRRPAVDALPGLAGPARLAPACRGALDRGRPLGHLRAALGVSAPRISLG